MTQVGDGPLLPGPFGRDRYVPVLLTRQGERLALRVLASEVKDRCTPVFVLHPVPNDLDSGGPKTTVDAHVRKMPAQLIRDWGTRPAMVDCRHLPPDERMSDGSHPLEWIVRTCAEAGLVLAPVLGPSSDAAVRRAAFDAADRVGTSLCIRLDPPDWVHLSAPGGGGELLAILAESGRLPGTVHLILDVAAEYSATTAITAAALSGAIGSLPHLNDWASLTVAGTGMPEGTADVGADNVKRIPRLEWQTWRGLPGSLPRRPSFGDYGVQHPNPMSDFDPRFMQSAAQLRYTEAQDWFVARGRGLRTAGTEQIRDLAGQVVTQAAFSGRGYSWGDDWIADCVEGVASPGNQMVWRKVTTSHHLTFVVRQIATLLGT